MPRWAVTSLLFVVGTALPGCPQLLTDRFGTLALVSGADAGGGRCARAECGEATLPDPNPDVQPGDAETEPVDPFTPELVDPGVMGRHDAGTFVRGPDASSAPACWTVQLSDKTQATSGNCLGIYGWNDVVVDEGSSTTLELSYRSGQACLEGTIAASGWGAVYNFTFADTASWNAAALGVTGFELRVVGPLPPAELEFIYTDGRGDFCRRIAPVATTVVPFDATHPDCATSPAQEVPDANALSFIRLHMPVASSARNVDFCLQLRAVP